jgi:hypothetical protein
MVEVPVTSCAPVSVTKIAPVCVFSGDAVAGVIELNPSGCGAQSVGVLTVIIASYMVWNWKLTTVELPVFRYTYCWLATLIV